jgi:hypothetical protein
MRSVAMNERGASAGVGRRTGMGPMKKRLEVR